MQQVKEVATILESQHYSINNIICDMLKHFKLKTKLNETGIRKAEGFSTAELMTILIMLPLMALKNVHQIYKSYYAEKVAMNKDTFYRFKNNERYSWRRLLYAIAKEFKKLTIPEEPSEDKITAFILDDTIDQRTGFKIENISYVFDHVLKRTVFGFKILVLSFFDGTSNIPIDFSIHTERKLEDKKRKLQFKKEVSSKSNGGKRRKEAGQSKIEQGITMIKRAVKNGFLVNYVLTDAWFTSHDFIKKIRDIKDGAIHIIAAVRNDNRKYTYDDQSWDAKRIISQLKKNGTEKRCRKYNIRYFEAVVDYGEIGKVKLFMCRYPHQKKWRVFITTNTKLSLTDVLKIYSIRWTIEVMFKETKQYLQLGGCMSQDFDAQIASTTITFITYTILSYIKRINTYYETTGEIWRYIQADVREKTLAERLWLLFEELLTLVIETMSDRGATSITELKRSEEFKNIQDLFASSFLFEQMDSVYKTG